MVFLPPSRSELFKPFVSIVVGMVDESAGKRKGGDARCGGCSFLSVSASTTTESCTELQQPGQSATFRQHIIENRPVRHISAAMCDT